jgi:cystathionine beta-lyase
MDFVSPEPVIRALRDRVEHGVFGYPEESGELRQLALERLDRLYGWQLEPEALVFLPGVVAGFNLACHTLASPAGNVLVQTPVYPYFLASPGYAGMSLREAVFQHNSDGSYAIDWEVFEAAITPETRLFILCNPHNPVGRVFTRWELSRMAEICLKHGVTICSDEIHCDLIYNGHKHTPIASLDAEVASRTITLMSPSKTYNLARAAMRLCHHPQRRERQQYRHSTKGLVGWVNLMGMAAAQAVYAGTGVAGAAPGIPGRNGLLMNM